MSEIVTAMLKTAFGTDADCQVRAARGTSRHITETLAGHAEQKIEGMNAAIDRLSKLEPAANISEALEQITQQRG